MKKLITAISLIAIILIISACSPAGGNSDKPAGTLNSGEEIATLYLNSEVGMVFEGSLEILKQKDPNVAVIEFKADTETEAQHDNKFVIGDMNGWAGVGAAKEESEGTHPKVTSTYDKNGTAKFDVEIETESDGTIKITFSNAANDYFTVENKIPVGSESITITFKTYEGEKLSHVIVGENFTWTQKAE